MFFFFFGLMFFIIKFYRFIFILISFEFMMMGLFYTFSLCFSSFLFFFFLNFSVVSSVLGLIFMIYMMKSFGNDKIMF